MKKYKYSGAITTGNTLDAGGAPLEVMLFPGRTVELPENDPWVQRLVARGFLTPVEADKKAGKTDAKTEGKAASAASVTQNGEASQ